MPETENVKVFAVGVTDKQNRRKALFLKDFDFGIGLGKKNFAIFKALHNFGGIAGFGAELDQVGDDVYPIQIEDVFKALRHYIKNNDTNNGIVVGGYSAGAEISSHLAFDTKRQNYYKINTSILKGFISISGVLNFNKCNSNRSKRLIKRYIYKSNTDTCNPINLINKNSTISTLCIHGDSDTLIDIENSKSFINNLKNVNNNSYLKIIKGAEHEDTIDIVRGNDNEYSKSA